ncbi:MAG: outer membrane lipoprotein carrier protein LolA [Rhodospirillales bacterium]
MPQLTLATHQSARRLILKATLAALLLGTALSSTGPALAQNKAVPKAPLSQQDREDVTRVEQYLNGLTTLQARFAQAADKGLALQGDFYIKRPGKLRFQYDPPAHIQVVADGRQVTYYDADNDQISQVPTGLTVAKFLVSQKISLSGDLSVTKVERDTNSLRLTMVQTKSPNQGYVVLSFADKPLQLQRWSVIDSRGRDITIVLTNLHTGVPLKDDLFTFIDPDPNRASRFRP